MTSRTFTGARGLLLLACGALTAGGCASQPPPRITVADVAVTDQSAEGLVVTFRMLAENAGSASLPLRTVRYSVSVDGRPAFVGERRAEATAPRAGSQEFILPVAFSLGEGKDFPSMPAATVPYTLTGSVEYELPGTIADLLFDSGIRRPTASFSETGRLDFSAVGPGAGGVAH
jgi:hypothetical protein